MLERVEGEDGRNRLHLHDLRGAICAFGDAARPLIPRYLRRGIRERMLALDLEFVANTPADAAARVRHESAKWKPVVERIDLHVD